MCKFEDLKWKVLKSIKGAVGDDEMIFTTIDGDKFALYYEDD